MPGDLAVGKGLAKGPSFERLSIIPKDVPLVEAIKSPRKTHSSRFHVTERRELEKLPALLGYIPVVITPLTVDVPTNNRPDLFMQKLEQCNVIFDFRDPSQDIRSKEIKRSTLQELLEYISSNRNVVQPSMYGKIVNMVLPTILETTNFKFATNLFRPIPPPSNPIGDVFDPEEDEPVMEAAWPHLQVVYEFFLRFIESQDLNVTAAKPYIDTKFVLQVFQFR